MAGRVVEKDAVVKVARQRLSVLEMAETLGNISEACPPGRHGPDEFLRVEAALSDARFGNAAAKPRVRNAHRRSRREGKAGHSVHGEARSRGLQGNFMPTGSIFPDIAL